MQDVHWGALEIKGDAIGKSVVLNNGVQKIVVVLENLQLQIEVFQKKPLHISSARIRASDWCFCAKVRNVGVQMPSPGHFD